MTTRHLPIQKNRSFDSGACGPTVRPTPPLAATDRSRLLAAGKALGDPTRLDIFRLIAAQDAPICACEVVDRFDVSQPTVAHHLRALRDAGLITADRRGVWVYYAVDPRGVAALANAFAGIVGTAEVMLAG